MCTVLPGKVRDGYRDIDVGVMPCVRFHKVKCERDIGVFRYYAMCTVLQGKVQDGYRDIDVRIMPCVRFHKVKCDLQGKICGKVREGY